jgi:DNA replication protein DnaC
MLTNQTSQILRALRLAGMAQAYDDQVGNPTMQGLTFDDRFGLLVDAERSQRDNRRVGRLLKKARLKVPMACGETIEFDSQRGLDKREMLELLGCAWIEQNKHLLITGATGVGKTWVACAIGTEAARKGITVAYKRLPRLLEELEIAHADGSLPVLRSRIARTQLLILDDWGVAPIGPRGRQDLLEVIDDRVPGGSVLITSQMPVDKWHEYLGEPTIADAILDRIIHSAFKIALKGESMRRMRAQGPKK